MTQAPLLPNAGIPPPIPDDFDFQARLVMPPLRDGAGRSLRIRNTHNYKAEIHNENSMDQTLNRRDDRAVFPDVGPPLIPMYAYNEEELQALSSSKDLRNEIRPLPAFVSLYIESIRKTKNAKTQDAPAEKGKAKSVLGSMALLHPIVRIPGERPPIIISDVFLHSIANKMYIPLNWFTNERLELAQHRLHDLHTKLFRPDPTSEGTASDSNRVITFDMLKMTALWGSDSSSTCLSPLQWQEAMKNYHSALVSLAPLPPTSNDPSQPAPPSFAGEFFKHFYFFTNYPNFEATYADWYSFERRARNDILMGILFDRQFYVNEVDGLRRAKEALMLYAPSSSLKRPADTDLQNTAKVPRTVNDSPHFFRAGDTAASARTPPSCVACVGAHTLRNHPSSASSFADGTQCFTVYRDEELWTSWPFRGGKDTKHVCIEFNLPSGCQ